MTAAAWAGVVAGCIVSIAATLFGVWLTFWIQHRQASNRFKLQHRLFGPWTSSYQTLDSTKREWVSEAILIEAHAGKVRLSNSRNSREYQYTATCEMKDDGYLYGEWESRQEGEEPESGVMILRLSDDKNCLYGYWTGKNLTGVDQFVGWVLGKLDTDVANGIALLRESSKTFPLADA
ncbi:MAG: hypothetical protein AAFY08_06235 [Planctomycetota bacterium]